jgi:putative membrane protein
MSSNAFPFRLAGTVLVTGALALPAAGVLAADEQKPSQQQSSQQQSGQQPSDASVQRAKLSEQDREFLVKAAQGGMLEVEAARLAQERASSAEVKEFAQTLLKDHQAANEKLQRIAADKGIALPKALDAKHKDELKKLSEARGEDFDRKFIQRMGLQDHKKDISMFEKQAKQGKDAQLKNFAEQSVPTLRKHLSMAQKIAGGGESAEAVGDKERDKEATGSNR